MATFAERLRELRIEKRITQEKLAERFYITKSAVSKYENGVNTPENKLLIDIADFFEVSVDYLLGKTEKRNDKDDYDPEEKAREILEAFKRAGKNIQDIDYEKLENYLRFGNIEKEK